MGEQGPPWYVDFFLGDYLKIYAHALTPERSAREADFVERELNLPRGSCILDLCCGTGRHAIPLAQRGYAVAGLDLSPQHLEEARRAAGAEGVTVQWVRADMRRVPFRNEFDAVINLFSSFGYLETDEEDFKVFQEVSKSLKPGGALLLDTSNRDYVLSHFIAHDWHCAADDRLVLQEREFDHLTSRIRVRHTVFETDGRRWESPGHVFRFYTLAELNNMLRRVGLKVQRTYGGSDGQEYSQHTRRMIVLARKDG